MEFVIALLQAAFAPLTPMLVLTVIISGLMFGLVYNGHLKLPKEVIYHTLVTGIGFLLFMLVYRTLTALAAGVALTNPGGWIGIAFIWALFCLFIWIGQTVRANRKNPVS